MHFSLEREYIHMKLEHPVLGIKIHSYELMFYPHIEENNKHLFSILHLICFIIRKTWVKSGFLS